MNSSKAKIAALEAFAVRIALLVPPEWLVSAIDDLQKENDPTGAAAYTVKILKKGQAIRTERGLSNEMPPQVPAPAQAITQDEIGRRNEVLIGRFEREVGISKSYTTVITGAGYAGLLALWNGLKGDLDHTVVLISGALVTLSVAMFVVWEMCKANLDNKASTEFTKAVLEKFWTADFETAGNAVRVAAAKRADALNRFQPLSFWFSAITGFGAAGLIVIAAVLKAAGVHFTLHIWTN
jgi:hypothetical protein